MKKKRIKVLLLIIAVLIVLSILFGLYLKYKNIITVEQQKQEENKNIAIDIERHYNQYVKTNKLSTLYIRLGNLYIPNGKIQSDEYLLLESKNTINYSDEYFKISNLGKDYFIYYKDVDKTDNLAKYSDRYKNYIAFNQNVVTKNNVTFYDEFDKVIYQFNNSFDLPIYIKKNNKYGVEYNNRLLYVKSDDVLKVYEHNNGDKRNTPSIAVLNYHFFYNDGDNGCNQSICLSTSNLEKHLQYIKNNNIFTPNMRELEMYIDGELQLPKSVVLTIDDGWRADYGSKVISKYNLNATVFLMSAYYDKNAYEDEYIEVHSHGHDIHNPGICPGGQGGAIKCMKKEKLLADLKKSREKLNNTTVFCYPFYEYNDYSISVLKEAGFTMAFGGTLEDGKRKVTIGSNKFKLPRYVIYNSTTDKDIASYIG